MSPVLPTTTLSRLYLLCDVPTTQTGVNPDLQICLQLNSRPVELLRDGQLITVPWRDVRCGDVVKVTYFIDTTRQSQQQGYQDLSLY